jgi:glycosyltransferase involved in cell wall biosynthesis
MIKINLSSGLRFNAGATAFALSLSDMDFKIYSSTPKNKWPAASRSKVLFRPLPFKIIEHFNLIKRNRFLREVDAIIFDNIVSLLKSECDIFHGWATFSLNTGKKYKKKGASFILDRACPHIDLQQSLLIEEAELTKSRYTPMSNMFLDRCLEEYELADKIIVPSNYSYNSFIQKGFKKSKIQKLKLNINYLAKKKKKKTINDNKFVLGTIGGNPLRKGIKYLIDAWQALQLHNATLLLKTSEFELKKNKDLFQRIKNDQTIKIMPYFKNIEDFYMQCDLFCLPSIDDGFGLAALEAMASGIPVITTENVGASEMVENNVSGFVGKIRDVTFLSEKILALYLDRNLLKYFSENSFSKYQSYLNSKDNYNNNVIKMYRSLFNKN